MKPIITWILIADSNHAHVVENTGPGHGLQRVAHQNWTAPQPVEFEDGPGRSFSSSGPLRHKMEPRRKTTEPGESFAKAIFADLMNLRRAKRFDRLILCAPPAMLGCLRKQLPDRLEPDVTVQVAKDLVHTDPLKLPRHFSHVLAI